MGFDAMAHEQYIQFIQEKHALPLPKDGWEMHQPPLYYAASAMLLDAVQPFGARQRCRFPAANRKRRRWAGPLLAGAVMFPAAFSGESRGTSSGIVDRRLPATAFVSFAIRDQRTACGSVRNRRLLSLPSRLAGGKGKSLSVLRHRVALGAAMLTKFSVVAGGAVFSRRVWDCGCLRAKIMHPAIGCAAWAWSSFRAWSSAAGTTDAFGRSSANCHCPNWETRLARLVAGPRFPDQRLLLQFWAGLDLPAVQRIPQLRRRHLFHSVGRWFDQRHGASGVSTTLEL